jgi:hypothetical protein
LFGSITVTGTDGNVVRIHASGRFRSRTRISHARCFRTSRCASRNRGGHRGADRSSRRCGYQSPWTTRLKCRLPPTSAFEVFGGRSPWAP